MEQSQAYQDGFRSGIADARLGRRSEYAWYGMRCESRGSYTYEYSRGYHAGLLSVLGNL
jgi:hypothetical protein